MIVEVPFKNKSFDSSSKGRGSKIKGTMYFNIQIVDDCPNIIGATTKYEVAEFNQHQQKKFSILKGSRKDFGDKFDIPFYEKDKTLTELSSDQLQWWERKMSETKHSPLSICKYLTGNNPTGSQSEKMNAELILDGGKYDGKPFFNLFKVFTNTSIKTTVFNFSDSIPLDAFLEQISEINNEVKDVIGDFFNIKQPYFYIDEMRDYIGMEASDNKTRLRNKFRRILINTYERKDQFYKVFSARKMVEAAHIKPVAHIEVDDEGVIADINNGILLSPDIHKLFDSGALTFNKDGKAVYTTNKKAGEFAISKEEVERLELDNNSIDKELLNDQRIEYLKYHSEHVYQKGV